MKKIIDFIKIKNFGLVLIIIFLYSACNSKSDVPHLTMPNNGLTFKEIENYKNYKIIATHFRKDKNELRYILANETAYEAYINHLKFSDGSKIVKIGWDAKEMPNFKSALEANEIQRVEYMIKDSHKFNKNPGNWGYARFVKKQGKYSSWKKGTNSCINCHNLAKDNDFLFTKFQHLQ